MPDKTLEPRSRPWDSHKRVWQLNRRPLLRLWNLHKADDRIVQIGKSSSCWPDQSQIGAERAPQKFHIFEDRKRCVKLFFLNEFPCFAFLQLVIYLESNCDFITCLKPAIFWICIKFCITWIPYGHIAWHVGVQISVHCTLLHLLLFIDRFEMFKLRFSRIPHPTSFLSASKRNWL